MKKIYPPAKLGVLGSGQLGRMFTEKAHQMGYTVHCYSPEERTPASLAGAREHVGSYLDFIGLRQFLDEIQALTFEFENIPEETLQFLESYEKKYNLFISPSPESIRISGNRKLEKDFFHKIDIPTTIYKYINSNHVTKKEVKGIVFPAILKTNRFGYDGKGQYKIASFEYLNEFLKDQIQPDFILENIIRFDREVSVIGARINSKVFLYPASENIHKNHILDKTIHPAKLSKSLNEKLIEYTTKLLENLNYNGVLGLEFFLKGNKIFANEFAPRPHNSGHYTQNAANFSQFDMQLFSLVGIIPEINIKTKQSTMKNIIGHEFFENKELLETILKLEDVHLHLYQKGEARAGRKMGHINIIGKTDHLNLDF
jgi:5-(carboxyamino)imidazole ribonucleotide synthase